MYVQEKSKQHYASFFKRVVAYFIDGFILTAILYGLANLGMLKIIGLDNIRMMEDAASTLTANSGYMVVLLVLNIVYYATFQSSHWQATIGKKLMRIKLETLDGNRVSFAKASLRQFIMISLSGILYIGYIMMFFNEKKQTLHDLVAKTVVVEAK